MFSFEIFDQIHKEDFELAMKIHKELNGVEAPQALQEQRQKDAGVQPLRPWLLPPRPVLPNSILPRPVAANQPSTSGIRMRPQQVQNSKFQVVQFARGIGMASQNSAGPSTTTAINIQPMQSCIKKPIKQLPNQVIKLQPKRLNTGDFHIQSLNTFISLEGPLTEWKIINVEPNMTFIMSKIKQIYFRYIPRVSSYTVEWNHESFTDLTNFSINPERKLIYLNRKTLLNCSRVHFISTFLHALIHCCVFETSHSRLRNVYDHDSNFVEIMRFFNEKLGVEIGTDHTFLRAVDQNLLTYQCQGRCSGMLPFFGVVKSHSDQDFPPQALIEGVHRETCNGKFHRVFEATRTTLNNNIETKFVVHSSIESPRGAATATEGCSIGNTNPRELVDITDDDAAGPKIVTMTPVIDLDDDEFSTRKKATRKIVETIKAIQPIAFETCPICSSSLAVYGGFRGHIDLCLGIQQG